MPRMPRYKKEKKLNQNRIQDRTNSQTVPFPKTVNGLNPLPNFEKNSILDSRLCSEYSPVKNYVENPFLSI